MAPLEKRRRLNYGDAFSVLVGDEERPYFLHQNFAVSKSRFLRAAIESGFKESIERTVKLPNVKTETFATYIHWLYNEEIALSAETCNDDHSTKKRSTALLELYVLADRLEDMKLRNTVIDEMKKLYKESDNLYESRSLSSVFESTPRNSTLRKWVVDTFYVDAAQKNRYLKELEDCVPAEFFFELACVLNGRTRDGKRDREFQEKCFYHEHNEDAPKCES